jgi:hypothetical protein
MTSISTALAVGAATRDITPDWPISLAGFASRTGPSEGARHPLHVRVVVLETDGSRIVVAGLDALNWGRQQAPRLRQQIAGLAGTTPDHVLLSATHSHSGPQTSFGVSRYVGVADQRFIDLLDRATLDATSEAIAALEPVEVGKSQAMFDLGIHRRLVRNGIVEHELTRIGPTDNRLTAIRFVTADGRIKAVLVHYTCHPVIVAEHYLSPEFPGFAMSRIEQVRAATSLYLQGFCGDINPDFTGRQEFRRGTDEDVQRTGGRLADLVLDLLDRPATVLPAIPLAGIERTIDLPFQALPDEQSLREGIDEPEVIGEWSRMMLNSPEKLVASVPLTLQRLDLTEGLSLLAVDAEVSVEYGLALRERTGDRVLPVGYSNGMVGYVTTARQIAEGGYEPVDSTKYYGLPAPFDPVIESRINDALVELVP